MRRGTSASCGPRTASSRRSVRRALPSAPPPSSRRSASRWGSPVRLIGNETCPLPDDPLLAAWAAALNDAGHWAEIFDRNWCTVYMTDDARRMYGGLVELAPLPLGVSAYGPDRTRIAMQWRGGQFPLDVMRRGLAMYISWIVPDLPGGRDELRALVDPRLADIV